MAANAGYNSNGDIESPNGTGTNEAYDNHSREHARNQTKEVLELNYRNSKHSAICSIVVFLALILLLGVILFVLIFFLDGPGSSQPEIEMQVEVKGQYVVAVSITIQNLDFRESLSDRNSKEYKDLEDQVQSAVLSAITGTDLKDGYTALEINNVRSGSVIVDFFIVFCDPLMTEDDIIQTVNDAMQTINSNSADKNNLEIDNSQLSVKAASENDLNKLRKTFCEPLVPTISTTGTTPMNHSAGVSSSVASTPTSSQLTSTMFSDVITSTPSSQTPSQTPTSQTQTPPPSSQTTTPLSQTPTPTPSSQTLTPTPSSLTQTPSSQTTTPLSQTPATTPQTPTPTPSSQTSTPTPSFQTQTPTPSSQAITLLSQTPKTTPSHQTSTPTTSSQTSTPATSFQTQTPTSSSQTPTPSSQTPTATPSSSFVTTQVPGTRTIISLSTTKISSMTTLMSSTSATETSRLTTSQSPTTSLSRTTTPQQPSTSVTPTPSTPSQAFTPPPVGATSGPTELSSLSPLVTTYQSSSETTMTSPVRSTTTLSAMTSSKAPTTQTPSPSSSVTTIAGLSSEEVTTQVAPPVTVPLTVCSASSSFFNPSMFFNSTDVLDGTPVNFQCSWTYLVAIPDVRIQIQFLTFDIGNDILEVDLSDSRTVTYTGSNIPSELTTDAHMARFTLKTDLQTNPINFSIFLQVILPENRVTVPMLKASTALGSTTLPGCSSSAQILGPGPPITITSPGYPRGYLNDLECTWQILTIGTNQDGILLDFVDFDLGDDMLEISSSNSNFISRRLTGSQIPAPISTIASQIELKFISDDATTATGFEVSIQLIESNAPCVPSHMFVSSGQSRVVTSPGYPISYPSNLACSWTLQSTQPNSQIIITFLNFDIGDDFLQVIYQGSVLRFSGSSLPMPVTVSNDRVELQFSSNGENQGPGFELEVSVQVPVMTTLVTSQVMTSSSQQNIISTPPDLSCTAISVLLTASSDPKTFASPGYPTYNYGPGDRCLWNFVVVDNTKLLKLQFVTFDVGNDVVSVDYGASVSKRLTGSNLPDDITTLGTSLNVGLSRSTQSSFPGFEAIVTVIDR